MEKESLQKQGLRVGGLLYTPAPDRKAAEHILQGSFDCLTSMVFCLEDSVMDGAVAEAEETLRQTLEKLKESGRGRGELPMLFVRVRTPEHLEHVHRMLEPCEELLTGFVLPKFDQRNADAFLFSMEKLRKDAAHLLAMPILETKPIADLGTRVRELTGIKARLDDCRDMILNVRVGGNDFSQLYGVRRNRDQTIYQFGIIRDILLAIGNLFSGEYIVSGPVWEYFGTSPEGAWAEGLRRELKQDHENGFLGKTAIHPSQLSLIFESLKVDETDVADARAVCGWDGDALGVAKGAGGDRMNEVKCHTRWARKILDRAEIYGIRKEKEAYADMV